MRVLAYTSPERGHLYPTMPTLLELAERGHDVSVRTRAEDVELLRALGLDAGPVDRRIREVPHDDYAARTPVGAIRRDARSFAARAPIELEDLRGAVAEQSPDVLLLDSTAWGAAVAGELSGLPWAFIAHFPLPLRSREAPPYGLGVAPRPGAAGRARDALLRAVVLGPLERMVVSPLNELRAQHGLSPLPPDGHHMYAEWAPLTLAYTAFPFEYPRSDWPERVRMVGPGAWDPPGDAPAWLEQIDRPLVLVTCSSEFQDDGKLAVTAVQALAGEDVAVVVTTAGVDPASVPGAPNARVERFLPHAPLLARAECVVCHAGMGITQKALAAGVPVVAVPFGRDQFEVARRVQVCDAGVRLSATRLRADRLRAAVAAARTKRDGARRIAAAFAAAGGAARAADALEALAADRVATASS
ncbi:MAG TPA: nucleotide disphospho-sugar-binding domain-containing protein [Solirubrobacteraceae bacterium]|nr:nucleotide disphospho-sugar-binding domain-containing protein [Solirubrobacteraceae bacterium]